MEMGERKVDPILVIMGHTASYRTWGPEIINDLLRGYYGMVLLDNRDIGESSRINPRRKLEKAPYLLPVSYL